MKLALLLEKLKKEGVALQLQTFDHQSRATTYMLTGTLPTFPHGARPVWYPLIVPDGKDEVPVHEVRAVLRHFWHSELEEKFVPEEK